MARKKKPEEHENLERYLVSYSDFITLLFATFVVLYALSQVDIAEFSKLEESIKSAFSNSMIDGAISIMQNDSNSHVDTKSANSLVEALMLEYVSVKYEEDSYAHIKEELEEYKKDTKIKDLEIDIDSRGLVIKIKNSDILFAQGDARLTPKALEILDKIGVAIGKRFVMHMIRVDGYTDNTPVYSHVYPSNWELSTARSCSIVRYLIKKFKFLPDIFTAAGYGDTRAIADNKTAKGREANRRVEIIVLRNKFKKNENSDDTFLKMKKEEQTKLRKEQLEIISKMQDLNGTLENIQDINVTSNGQKIIDLGRQYQKENDRLEQYNPNVIEPIVQPDDLGIDILD